MARRPIIGRGTRSTIHLDPVEMRQLMRALRGARSLEDSKAAIIKVMKEAAEPARADMERNAPVDTGVLSNSFRSRKLLKVPPRVFGIRVGAVSESKLAGWRAHFTELGTKHHAAQPFIARAIARQTPKVLQNLRVGLQSLLNSLIK